MAYKTKRLIKSPEFECSTVQTEKWDCDFVAHHRKNGNPSVLNLATQVTLQNLKSLQCCDHFKIARAQLVYNKTIPMNN